MSQTHICCLAIFYVFSLIPTNLKLCFYKSGEFFAISQVLSSNSARRTSICAGPDFQTPLRVESESFFSRETSEMSDLEDKKKKTITRR